MTGTEAAFVVSQEQVSCDLSGEAVILNLATGMYYGLNPVGTRVWELLQQPRTVAELREALLSEFDVDSGRCERDLVELLDDLASRQLIHRHEPVREAQFEVYPPE
jgi:hypothetical protein